MCSHVHMTDTKRTSIPQSWDYMYMYVSFDSQNIDLLTRIYEFAPRANTV